MSSSRGGRSGRGGGEGNGGNRHNTNSRGRGRSSRSGRSGSSRAAPAPAQHISTNKAAAQVGVAESSPSVSPSPSQVPRGAETEAKKRTDGLVPGSGLLALQALAAAQKKATGSVPIESIFPAPTPVVAKAAERAIASTPKSTGVASFSSNKTFARSGTMSGRADSKERGAGSNRSSRRGGGGREGGGGSGGNARREGDRHDGENSGLAHVAHAGGSNKFGGKGRGDSRGNSSNSTVARGDNNKRGGVSMGGRGGIAAAVAAATAPSGSGRASRSVEEGGNRESSRRGGKGSSSKDITTENYLSEVGLRMCLIILCLRHKMMSIAAFLASICYSRWLFLDETFISVKPSLRPSFPTARRNPFRRGRIQR